MAKLKSFNEILSEIKDKKKQEKEINLKFEDLKCKKCGGHIKAIGLSNIPGLCIICASLALIPENEKY
jgi:ribosomal protein S27E